MTPKHVVNAPAMARPFFDRKVRGEGYTRTMSVGKVLPHDWRYIRLRKLEETEKQITLQIECLLKEERKSDKRNKDRHQQGR